MMEKAEERRTGRFCGVNLRLNLDAADATQVLLAHELLNVVRPAVPRPVNPLAFQPPNGLTPGHAPSSRRRADWHT